MKLLVLVLEIASLTQLTQQRSSPNEVELKRERARAVSLVEQVGSEAEFWDDKKSAVEALASAADLLWDQNPARAAKWLRRAWELTDKLTDSEQNSVLKEFTTQSDKSQLKAIVLKVAHARSEEHTSELQSH